MIEVGRTLVLAFIIGGLLVAWLCICILIIGEVYKFVDMINEKRKSRQFFKKIERYRRDFNS